MNIQNRKNATDNLVPSGYTITVWFLRGQRFIHYRVEWGTVNLSTLWTTLYILFKKI